MSDGRAGAGVGPGPGGQILSGGVQRDAYQDLLRNRRFRSLALAILTSTLGDWVGLFAILALTESMLGTTRAAAFALSGIMVARVVPTLLLGPVAGVFVDRWDRRRTMIATDLGRGAVMILVAFSGDIFQLVVATFLIEVMATLFIPAKDATVPNLVARDQLVRANQLSLMLTYGTLPLGAALFAVLAAAGHAVFGDIAFFRGRPEAVAIWLNALSFFASAFFISRIGGIREPRPAAAARQVAIGSQPGAWQDLKEGFAFIANHPLVRALVFGVMGAFLAAGVVASGVGKLFATILNARASGFGVLGFAVGMGLFAGLASANRLSQRIGKERLLAPGIGVAGAALVVTAFMWRLDVATIPAFVMGAGAGLAFVTGYTLLQEQATDEVRGRTFAAFNTGVRAALFASLVVGPLLVGAIGIEGRNPVTGTYLYSIGGVRITLALGGLIALGGAVWTGRAMHRAYGAPGEAELSLGAGDEVVSGRRGLFVVFEGGEGAGKSTQLRLLRAAIERAGLDVVASREPGGTAIGARIRDVLLDSAATQLSDRAEALLYAADRAQHADEVIRPALARGAVVLSDRYVDSSVAYQGVGRGLGDGHVEELNRWGSGGLMPDLVVLLDIDAVAGLARAGAEPDRLEAAGVAFHRRVNEAFRRRAASDPARYLVVDATRSVEDVHAEVRTVVLGLVSGPRDRGSQRSRSVAGAAPTPDRPRTGLTDDGRRQPDATAALETTGQEPRP